MKYKICATSSWNKDELLERYPCIKEFGLEIESDNDDYEIYIYIDNLEDLMRLMKCVDHSIVMHNDPYTIEIYDDWRE